MIKSHNACGPLQNLTPNHNHPQLQFSRYHPKPPPVSQQMAKHTSNSSFSSVFAMTFASMDVDVDMSDDEREVEEVEAMSFMSNIAEGEVTDIDIDMSDDEQDVDEVENVLSHAPGYDDDVRDVDEVEDILSHVPVYEAAVHEDAVREDVDVLDAVQTSISGVNVALKKHNSIEDDSISTGPYRAPRQYVEAIQTQPTNGGEEGKYHIHHLLIVDLKLTRTSLRSRGRATFSQDDAHRRRRDREPSASSVYT